MKDKLTRFHVEVGDGGFVFKSPSHKRKWKLFLDQFKGQEVTLQIDEKKPKRSDLQNRYYWLYLTAIEDETGHEKLDLHELFKGKFISEGITEVFGEKVRKKKSTTQLTKNEFSEYIEKIERFTGIPAPDTREYWGYDPHEM